MGNAQKLKVYLDTSVISYLKQDDACFELAKEIIDKGILPSKSIDDSYHIATAMVNNCDIIASWNFRHMVNVQTINGIRTITQLKGYKSINIFNPLTLLEMEV